MITLAYRTVWRTKEIKLKQNLSECARSFCGLSITLMCCNYKLLSLFHTLQLSFSLPLLLFLSLSGVSLFGAIISFAPIQLSWLTNTSHGQQINKRLLQQQQQLGRQKQQQWLLQQLKQQLRLRQRLRLQQMQFTTHLTFASSRWRRRNHVAQWSQIDCALRLKSLSILLSNSELNFEPT